MPPPQTQHTQEPTGITDPYFANLYFRSRAMTADALEVVSRFEKANEITCAIETSAFMDNDWGEDNETAAKVLAIGHQVGMDRVEALLAGEAAPDVEPADAVFANAIYASVEDAGSAGWGQMARKLLKVQKKQVRLFAVAEGA